MEAVPRMPMIWLDLKDAGEFAFNAAVKKVGPGKGRLGPARGPRGAACCCVWGVCVCEGCVRPVRAERAWGGGEAAP